MLYSILVGILSYTIIRGLISGFVSAPILQALILVLGLSFFVGAFFAKKHKRKILFRILIILGIFTLVIPLGFWFVHPIVRAKTWVTFLAVIAGGVLYFSTRKSIRRILYKKNGGEKPTSPTEIKKWKLLLEVIL